MTGALAAACAGFLDLFGIPAGTPAFRTALVHMTLNLPLPVVLLHGALAAATLVLVLMAAIGA